MATSTRKSTPTTAPQLPTRQSSRKIIKKSLGEEFVSEFPPRGSLSNLTASTSTPGPGKRGPRGKVDAILNPSFNGKKYKQVEESVICSECLKRKPAGQPNGIFLRCTGKGCGYAAHTECLKFSKETVALVKDRYKCMECKRCAVCGKGSVATDMALIHCKSCDTIYHMRCHHPPVDPNSPELEGKYRCFSNWTCSPCKIRKEKATKHIPARLPRFANDDDEADNDYLPPSYSRTERRKMPVDYLKIFSNNTTESNYDSAPIKKEDNSFAPNEHDASQIHEDSEEENDNDSLSSVVPDHPDSPEILPTGPKAFTPDEEENEEEEVQEEWNKELYQDPSVNGHDYIVTAMAPDERPEVVKSQYEKDYEDSLMRQQLVLYSAEECAVYFDEAYGPDLGDLIRKHALMGSSLVLLNRAQFIELFGLSLGSALKMHNAVCKWRKSFF